VTFRHTFVIGAGGGGAPGPDRSDPGGRQARRDILDPLRSTVDDGLSFYWTLASTASDVAGGAPGAVEISAAFGADGSSSRGREPDRGREPRPPDRIPPLPPALSTSLVLDLDETDGGDGRGRQEDLTAFTEGARALVHREQCRRSLRFSEGTCRAVESRAVHDLRALLQPLLLHVDQLRRAGGVAPDDLELLDDLTGAILEWLEEELDGGGLAEDVRLPSRDPAAATDLRSALDEAMEASARDRPRMDLPDELPEIAIDQPLLVAGLLELVEFGDDARRSLRAARRGERSVRLRVELDGSPAVVGSPGAESDDPGHPPVTGGLLNLVAWTKGEVHLQVRPGKGGAVEARLPLEAPA